MHKVFALALPLLALQSALAAEGGPPSGQITATPSSAWSIKGTERASFGYAIAFNPADPFAGTEFGLLDIVTGMFRGLAELPNGAQGLARDDGRIYTVDSSNNLVRINPVNGKTTIIGPTGVTEPGPVGETRVDVVASLETGELFLMDYSNNLYSVDRKTGAATLIGPTGIPAIISPLYSSSLAGDCANLFFTIDEVDENRNPIIPPTLYRIDPRTGSATFVGPTASVMPGSGFINGTLYGFSLDLRPFGGTDPPRIFAIDLSTGAATRISDLNVPGVGGAVKLAVPERCQTR